VPRRQEMVSTGMREREIKGEREREKKREREREWGERKRERERGRERDRKTRECLHSRWPSQGPAQAELSTIKPSDSCLVTVGNGLKGLAYWLLILGVP